ncbi:ATP-binding protein [Candidatus Woesearchaeota archaeon]|nr:ATP-binding protein [Candidatus Woesearchaeota archaeon]
MDELKQVFLVWAFRILVVMAILAAFFKSNWVNLLISIFILIISFPVFVGKKNKVTGLEFLVLFFIFALIYFSNLGFLNALFWWWNLFIRFVLGILAVLVGFLLIFIINNSKKKNLEFNVFFITLFCFSFALMSGLLWEIFKFLIGIFFDINLFSVSLEKEFWGVVIFSLGSFFASLMGYLHLIFFKHSFLKKHFLNLLRKNPDIFKGVVSPKNYLVSLIKRGESEDLEFKSALRTNLFTKEHDKRIEHSILKTILAFMNTGGGKLLIGVSDEGKLIGLDNDGFKSLDKFSLHLTNLIDKNISNGMSNVSIDFIEIDDVSVCIVYVKSSRKHLFLNYLGQEEFYIRFGPSSVKLTGSRLVDYINGKYKKVY